ncbi:MAG: ATP synthase subunit I [Elainellaceae cyanobacterium]
MTDRAIAAIPEQANEPELTSPEADGSAIADVSTEAEAADSTASLSVEPDDSIQEYFQLRRELLILTLVLTGVAVGSVWLAYGLNVALNYFIGACTGLIYLNMLAKHVGQLGRQRARLGNSRLALLVGVILIASRVNQLEILPIFLGFLTYKAALIVYVLRGVLVSDSSS